MKIRMDIDKKAAIMAGQPSYGVQVVDLDISQLSPEDRETLAGATHSDGALTVVPWGEAPSADLDGLRAALIQHREYIADQAARKSASDEKRRQEAEALADKIEADIGAGLYRRDCCRRNPYDSDAIWIDKWEVNLHGSDAADSLRLRALLPILNETASMRNNEILVRAEESAKRSADEKQARKQKECVDRARLQTWAEINGSDLLKSRIAGAEQEGWEWVKLARQEYGSACEALIADIVGPRNEEKGETEERTTPTLQEIEALQSVREALATAGVNGDANLVWFVPEVPEDEYGEASSTLKKRCLLKVAYVTPDEHKVVRYYEIPEK